MTYGRIENSNVVADVRRRKILPFVAEKLRSPDALGYKLNGVRGNALSASASLAVWKLKFLWSLALNPCSTLPTVADKASNPSQNKTKKPDMSPFVALVRLFFNIVAPAAQTWLPGFKKSCLRHCAPTFSAAETNQSMLRSLKISAVGILVVAFLCVAWRLGAQGSVPPTNKIAVRTKIDKGVIIFSWPVMRGKWNLYEKERPYAGDWKPVADALHHTNDTVVTVNVPLPTNTTLYLVKRTFRVALPPLPKFPAMPPRSTNRPPDHP